MTRRYVRRDGREVLEPNLWAWAEFMSSARNVVLLDRRVGSRRVKVAFTGLAVTTPPLLYSVTCEDGDGHLSAQLFESQEGASLAACELLSGLA